jgi:hypothetical protein
MQIPPSVLAGLYFLSSYIMLIASGYLVWQWTDSTKYSLNYHTGFMNQAAQDWNTTAYNEIWTTNQTDCGPYADEVFER